MQRKRYQRKQRDDRGIGCIEVGISAFLMIALATFGLDLSLLMFGINVNDSACRDAARSAAQQSTQSKALAAAQSELKIHATDGYWISQPVLRSTTSPDFVYNDFSGNPPANVSSYVTVTTTTNIRCPAPIFFFGATFLRGGTIQCSRSYTFPIVKEKYYG